MVWPLQLVSLQALCPINDFRSFVVLSLPQADLTAPFMRSLTRSAGLSLADRLCLALACRLKAKALTADRAWTLVAEPLGLDVVLIRGDAH